MGARSHGSTNVIGQSQINFKLYNTSKMTFSGTQPTNLVVCLLTKICFSTLSKTAICVDFLRSVLQNLLFSI